MRPLALNSHSLTLTYMSGPSLITFIKTVFKDL